MQTKSAIKRQYGKGKMDLSVAASMGAWGAKCSRVGGSSPPPLAPQSEEKIVKISHFGKFLDFCPLRIAFCPLDAPHKKISGAATGNYVIIHLHREPKYYVEETE